jgi:hypothetical protein
MDYIHYKHNAYAIWDKPIKNLVLNKINEILPTYLASYSTLV